VDVIDPRPEISPVTQKVLLAEDEVLVRLSVAAGLRNEGLEVFEAANAEEAISILKTMQVDVVITDLYMRTPADGLEVANYVRAHCPGTALLLASAMTPPVMAAPGFDAFFVKPYQPDDLVRWIKRHRPATSDPFEEQRP
jgi:two-component system, response regulator PdtaR